MFLLSLDVAWQLLKSFCPTSTWGIIWDNYIPLPRYLCHLWLVIHHCRLLCLLVSISTCRVEAAKGCKSVSARIQRLTKQKLIHFIKIRQTICPNKSYPTMQQSKSQPIKNRNTPSTWGQWRAKTTLPNIMLQRGASSSKCWEHLSLDIHSDTAGKWDEMIPYLIKISSNILLVCTCSICKTYSQVEAFPLSTIVHCWLSISSSSAFQNFRGPGTANGWSKLI